MKVLKPILSNLYSVDALIHVVRCFENKDITHIDKTISPVNDIEIIETELLLSDLSKIENIIENLQKKNKGKVIDQELMNHLKMQRKTLEGGSLLKDNINLKDLVILNSYNLLTNKPVIYVCNVDEKSVVNGNDLSHKVEKYVEKRKLKF